LDRRSLLQGFSILYWGDLYFTVFDNKVLDKVLYFMLIVWETVVMLHHLAPRPTRDMRLLQHPPTLITTARISENPTENPILPYDSENPWRQRARIPAAARIPQRIPFSLATARIPAIGILAAPGILAATRILAVAATGILAVCPFSTATWPFYGDMSILWRHGHSTETWPI
jgi:hypothetical protein